MIQNVLLDWLSIAAEAVEFQQNSPINSCFLQKLIQIFGGSRGEVCVQTNALELIRKEVYQFRQTTLSPVADLLES